VFIVGIQQVFFLREVDYQRFRSYKERIVGVGGINVEIKEPRNGVGIRR